MDNRDGLSSPSNAMSSASDASLDSVDVNDVDRSVRESFLNVFAPGINTEYLRPVGVHIGWQSDLMKAELADGTKVMLKFPVLQLDDYNYCLMTLREIKYMSNMNHENVMRLRRVGGNRSHLITRVFIEMDFMEHTLKYLIENPAEYFNIVADSRVRCMYQILSGLAYIHSAKLVHRDIQPSGILYKRATSSFKIANFHMARKVDRKSANMTKYAGARTHLAPEIAMKPSSQSPAMDIYAAGIILIEILRLDTPFFFDHGGMFRIQEILLYTGLPDDDDLADISTDYGKDMVRTLASGLPKKLWKDVFPELDRSAMELVDELLQFSSTRRITAANALQHPYFASVRPAGWVAPTYVGTPLEDYTNTIPIFTLVRQLRDSITVDMAPMQ